MWYKMDRMLRIAQPVLFLLLGSALFFWERAVTLLPLDFNKIIGGSIALAAGVFFYFDRKLESLSPQHRIFIHVSISRGITLATQHVKNPSIIRIYAFSSYMIQPILKDLNIRTGECKILFYGYHQPNDKDNAKEPDAQKQFSLAPINEWYDMKKDGLIGDLEIKRHDFYPLIYFVLFDDRALLVGHYIIKDDLFPRCGIGEPFLILDKSEDAKLTIQKYLKAFESLRTSCKACSL